MWGGGGRAKEGDGEDERMGGCDTKYTHLSSPREKSLLRDRPGRLYKKLRERTGLTTARTFPKHLCFIE